MKLWLFNRGLEYNEDYGILIRAESAERAWEMYQKMQFDHWQLSAEFKPVPISEINKDTDNPWIFVELSADGPEEIIGFWGGTG